MMLSMMVVGLILPAFFISLMSVALIKRCAVGLQLLDQPSERKVHVSAIPLGGGLGIWFSLIATFGIGTAFIFLVSPALLNQLHLDSLIIHLPGLKRKALELWAVIGCATVLCITGLLDDRRGLSWKIRIGIETLVAMFVVFVLQIRLTAFIGVAALGSLITILWIVTLINSFNMLDNMDGLSGGVASIICGVLAIMLLTNPDATNARPQLFVAAMLLVLLGGLLGFLWHNWPPATIFMGDAGSYLVGFWIAIATLLTTYTSYDSNTPHVILAPICALAIPLYDTLSVILIRLAEGRSPFQADKRHFSHRLVELGLSKRSAVLTIYLATLTTALGALLLQRTDLFGAVVVLTIVACTCTLMAMLELLAFRRGAT